MSVQVNKWYGFLGIAGLVVCLFGVLGGFLIGFTEYLMVSHIVLGAMMLIAWLLVSGLRNANMAGSVLTGRRSRYSFNFALYGVVFIGILICFNWFAKRNNVRWDLTTEKVYSLADQSVQVLQDLKQPLTMVAFMIGGGAGSREADLLKLYAQQSKVVNLTIVDPNSKPHLVEKYKMDSGAQTFGNAGHRLYVGLGKDGEISGDVRLDEITEESITNAIVKLTRGQEKKIYYVVGHEEPDIADEGKLGTKLLADALRDEHLKVEKLGLAEKGGVPDDAAAVLLIGAQRPLLDSERGILIKYVEDGGRLVMMTDPRYPTPPSGVRELSEHFGIEVGGNIVIDKVQRLFAAPALGVQPMARSYGIHNVTKSLKEDDFTIFDMASSVSIKDGADTVDITRTELVKTGPAAWGESNLGGIFASEQPSAVLDDSDKRGPVGLAVAYEKTIKIKRVEQEQEQEKEEETRAGRVVVFGDSDWVRNSMINIYSNKDLALNVINWVAGEESAITIRPRSMKVSMAPISQDTVMYIMATSFLIPEMILLFGLTVWWRRRVAGA